MRLCSDAWSSFGRLTGVDLIYYQEKSVRQVSHLIGIPASTVKTRMFYARNRIARQLGKEGVDRASL